MIRQFLLIPSRTDEVMSSLKTTEYVWITYINWLMLFTEQFPAYTESQVEHMNRVFHKMQFLFQYYGLKTHC
jgi:hypothetical protein